MVLSVQVNVTCWIQNSFEVFEGKHKMIYHWLILLSLMRPWAPALPSTHTHTHICLSQVCLGKRVPKCTGQATRSNSLKLQIFAYSDRMTCSKSEMLLVMWKKRSFSRPFYPKQLTEHLLQGQSPWCLAQKHSGDRSWVIQLSDSKFYAASPF